MIKVELYNTVLPDYRNHKYFIGGILLVFVFVKKHVCSAPFV